MGAHDVLSGDVAAAIGELKAKRGGELQVDGSGALVRWLLDNHLVDEITLLTYDSRCTESRNVRIDVSSLSAFLRWSRCPAPRSVTENDGAV